MVSDTTVSLSDATETIRCELLKSTEKQDFPLLTKMHTQTFTSRRDQLTTYSDGLVGVVIEEFELLGDIRFVSMDLDIEFQNINGEIIFQQQADDYLHFKG